MRDHFPSYEAFWVPHIVPLTYRLKDRQNVYFQTDEELAEAGYAPEDVAVAQLHYTLLNHLGRVFELLDDVAGVHGTVVHGEPAVHPRPVL
jgi:hypothetical protein